MQQSRVSLIPCAALVNVEFLVPELPLEFGQSLKIVGGAPALGNWEASTGCSLEWAEGNNWKGAAEIEAGSEVEFKLVKVAGGDWSSWEDGDNKVLAVPVNATGVEVVCSWGGDLSTKISESAPEVEETPKKAPTKAKAAPKKVKEEIKAAEPAVAAAPAFMAPVAEKEEEVKEEVVAAPAAPVVAESAPTPTPTHAASSNGSDGVNLSSELTSLASKISVGSDGALIIEFNGSADNVTAASLAAKYKN